MSDFTVSNHGSIFLLTPLTPAGDAWIHDNVALDQSMMFGNAVAVEHRYIADILAGIVLDGLEVA